ncbi:MAG: hypothetical protein AAB444_00900 [Patescibacteria group bacterium]
MDYMILTGVVLAVIVPLIFISTERLSDVGISQVTEAINVLKTGVLEIDNLGYGTGTRVVIQIPKGVETYSVSKNGVFSYTINKQLVSAQVPSNLVGALPITEGRHFINLFNDGNQIYFYQCGNYKIEAFEQCDELPGTIPSACTSSLGCIDPSSPTAACRCYCDPENPKSCESSTTSGNCVTDPRTTISYCAPCTDDSQCKPGNICQFGNCVEDVCASSEPGGVRCGSFLNPICCKQGDLCVNNQCVTPCGATNLCPGGQICSNGQCQDIVCGDGRIDNPPEICEPPGSSGPGNGCLSTEQCDSTCKNCVLSSSVCGNDKLDPGEECDLDSQGKLLAGSKCSLTEYCDSPGTCTCGSVQQYCPTQTLCSGNYVCDTTNTCSPCDATNPCPNGYSCLADGTCRLPLAGQCGNAQLEPGEECEYLIGSAGQFTITSACTSSTKPTCSTQDCMCYPNPLTGFCGDGTLQSGIGEECDEGANNGGSSTTCQSLGLGPVCGLDCRCARSGSYCGNGPPPDLVAGEKCEPPGSFGPNNGCPSSGSLCGTDCSCSAPQPQCGNGRVEPGEECDTRAFPGCLIGSPLTPFGSYCTKNCNCMYIDNPPPFGGTPPPGGNPLPPPGKSGPGGGNPSGAGYTPPGGSGSTSKTCQEDDPRNPGQKKPTCNQASDCGDPTQYWCRYNCCFPKPTSGSGTAISY